MCSVPIYRDPCVLEIAESDSGDDLYLYKTKLIQAAPGKVLEVIDLLKASQAGYKNAGDEPPLHFAESAGISEADQDAAAKAAGFESANRIGPYLRTLIRSHHDTLAVSVK